MKPNSKQCGQLSCIKRRLQAATTTKQRKHCEKRHIFQQQAGISKVQQLHDKGEDVHIDGFSSSDSENCEYKYFSGSAMVINDSKRTTKRKTIYEEVDDVDESEEISWKDSEDDILSEASIGDHQEDVFIEEITQRSRLQDITITQCCSDDETFVKQKKRNETSLAFDEATQDTIDEPSPSPQPCVNLKRLNESKETELLKNTTPKEETDDNDSDNEIGKKISRLIKGGLAERLKKVLSREKSSQAFWKHDSKLKRDEISCLNLKVLSVEISFSTALLQCNLLSKNSPKVYILLHHNVMKNSEITEKKFLKVFPPWKKMFSQDLNSIVLLCVHNFIVEDEITLHDLTGTEQNMIQFYEKHANLTESQEDLHNFLTTLQEKDLILSSPTLVNTKYENIEDSLQHLSTTRNISFCARVQRVITRKHATNKSLEYLGNRMLHKISQILLVQDKSGTMAEIEVTEDIRRRFPLWSNLEDALGTVCAFSGLTFVQRKSLNRHPAIASMYNQFIEQSQSNVSQTETDSIEESLSQQSSSLLYIYHFTVTDISRRHFNNEPTLHVPYSSPTFTNHYCMDSKVTNSRLSILVQLLTIARIDGRSIGDSLDQYCVFHGVQLKKEGRDILAIRKLSTCFVSELVKESICQSKNDRPIRLHLKDVRFFHNEFILDAYSTIALLDEEPLAVNVTTTELEHPCVPRLTSTSKERQIVSIEGLICGVDEETALFWNVCDECKSDEVMHGEENGKPWCRQCNKETVVTLKMQLDIYLYDQRLRSVCILCKLLESTISTLLPVPSEKSFEGYDINSILRRKFGPVLCEVVDNRKKAKHGSSILLKELPVFSDYEITH